MVRIKQHPNRTQLPNICIHTHGDITKCTMPRFRLAHDEHAIQSNWNLIKMRIESVIVTFDILSLRLHMPNLINFHWSNDYDFIFFIAVKLLTCRLYLTVRQTNISLYCAICISRLLIYAQFCSNAIWIYTYSFIE